MDLIDIGSNLTHESFQHDLDEVLARAQAAAVNRQVITGTSVATSEAAIHLHHRYPTQLFATAGVHPHHASDLDAAALRQLEQLATSPSVVAIGECGLDYYRNFAPREAQRAAFAQQLELAARVGKPVFLHQRDAHADFIAILREHHADLKDAVAHCFTGTGDELDDYLALGIAVGITGWICDERRGEHLKQLVGRIPATRLMIETDSPYLLPRSLRPKPATRRNEPAFLVEVARVVAQARGETLETCADTTTAAAEAFFAIG
jgi:TatD DNase family protein